MHTKTQPTIKRTAEKNLLKNLLRHWQLYVIIVLPVAYIVIFHYLPMVGILIAFKNYRPTQGIFGSEWVGLKYFIRFFNTPSAIRTIRNTLYLSIYSLLAGFPFPILLALFLNEVGNLHYKKTVQLVTYAPYFISTVVFVGLLFQFLNYRIGYINRILELFGRDRVNFMGKWQYFRHIYVWSGIYKDTGYGAVIYIAALACISPELHEAALIDGASRIQRIVHINIPGLLPTIVIMFVLRCGHLMSVGFEKVFLLQNDLNLVASETIATFVYKVGFRQTDYSFSTAVGFFNSTVNLIMIIIVNSISKRLTQSSLW